MSAEQLPAPHVRWVFAGQMLRAGLMSWGEFEAELIAIYGPDFGPAIADQVADPPSADPRRHRRDRSVPRRI